MFSILHAARRFYTDQRGMETLEYAIIAGLILIGTLVTLAAIGLWVASIYTNTQAALGA